MGANTIRTWGCGSNTLSLLDSAQKNGLKVMLGLWLRHGRPGAEGDDDFNYVTNKKGKKKQYDDIMEWVKMYKEHPALLLWGVGNEVILNIETEEEKVAYAKFLEKVSKEIK